MNENEKVAFIWAAVCITVVAIAITLAVAASYPSRARNITCTSLQIPTLVRQYSTTYNGSMDRTIYTCAAAK